MKKVDNPSTPKKSGERKMATKEVLGVVVGRDKKVIPPEEVQKLAAIGMKDIEIAEWFGIDGNTLRYNFSVELVKGRLTLNMSLRRAMITNACTNMNAAVQIFLAKNYLSMTDSPIDNESNQPLPWEALDD
jgi:hypothetical protein